MKILVDKMPESPRACPFSIRNVEYGYFCTLQPYNEETRGKPRCLCKCVETCDRLLPVGRRVGLNELESLKKSQ